MPKSILHSGKICDLKWASCAGMDPGKPISAGLTIGYRSINTLGIGISFNT